MHVKVATVSDEDFDDGWDMSATLVDGRWVDRSPRRPEIEPQVRREAALMPWLAPLLPLPVPVPRVVSEDPLTVRHTLIVGEACLGSLASHGAAVGRFLRALHTVDVDGAVAHGARDAAASFAAVQRERDRMAAQVLPLLPQDLRGPGEALLERMAVPPAEPRLVHGDLGPHHILVVGDEVTGVIDWGDCGVGDPALDLAWTRYGAEPAFAGALETAYAPDDDVLARGLDWHLLGPWHEVLYGLDTDQPDFVESGLEGTVTRLRRVG
jgi:aminoglycoside phosphotransferase (APT) family kinase protein